MGTVKKIMNKLRMAKLRFRFRDCLQVATPSNIIKQTYFIINDGSKMEIGKHFSTNYNVHLTACGGGYLKIGDNVSLNRNDIIICRNKISIGNHVAFGPNVVIYDHDHKYDINGFENTEFKTGEVIIDDNCWIAANVTILRNTHIGEGCVIGAGTVVKGDIPAHSIVTASRDVFIKPIGNHS